MANGIYVAASGTVSRLQEMEVLANNLANAGSAGFKRDEVVFQELDADRQGPLPRDEDKDFVRTLEAKPRLDEGALRSTGNPLDVAVSGPGFLRVLSSRGERMTRDGRLLVGKDGTLRTMSGLPVLSRAGTPIHLPPDRAIDIDEAGRIRAGDLDVADLGIAKVPLSARLDKDEAGLFLPPAAPPDTRDLPEPTVLQGFVEDANVSPVQAMTGLIEVQRHYEALHQVITTYREMDQAVVRLPG